MWTNCRQASWSWASRMRISRLGRVVGRSTMICHHLFFIPAGFENLSENPRLLADLHRADDPRQAVLLWTHRVCAPVNEAEQESQVAARLPDAEPALDLDLRPRPGAPLADPLASDH